MIYYRKDSKASFDKFSENAANDGVAILIDKERDWTSFDVVAKIRSLTDIKKIGHAGALDPLAMGLLIVCVGRKATKQMTYFQRMRKKYKATVKLGAVTVSDDSETSEENRKPIDGITKDCIAEATKKYIGKIEQIPPLYSAKKIKGRRAYKYARKNQNVELKPATVEVYSIDLIDYNPPFAKLDIECSKGTYIRSLARDIGADLDCGAYLSGLRRTAIGDFTVDNAFKIKEFENLINKVSEAES